MRAFRWRCSRARTGLVARGSRQRLGADRPAGRARPQSRASRLSAVAPADASQAVDLHGRQLWPALIDVHTHLDRAHTVVRSPNQNGTFADAVAATQADRLLLDARRSDRAHELRHSQRLCARRLGDPHPSRLHSRTSRAKLARVCATCAPEWQGRVALQGVSLVPIDLFRDEWGDKLAALVAKSGGILGAVTRASTSGAHGAPLDDLDALLDRLFMLAARHDLDIDLHVDESGDPRAAALAHVARAAIRNDYRGRVTCGHCCSLAVQPEADADRTLDLVAEAKVAIVTLPTVNLYLQDRAGGRTPRWRGVTLVHEMRRRGIVVAAAGDNCRDCFYAYGDHDMVDTFRQAVRILHLDHPLAEAPTLVGPAPATHRAAVRSRPHPGRRAGAAPGVQRPHAERTGQPSPGRSHRDRRRPALQRTPAGLFRDVGRSRRTGQAEERHPC